MPIQIGRVFGLVLGMVAATVLVAACGGPAAPTCSSATCGGCCRDGKCETGTEASACGTGGGACSSCGEGTTCSDGACVTAGCDATTCPDGCCDGDACVSGTSSEACGSGGATCQSCGSGGTCVSRVCKGGSPCSSSNPTGYCPAGQTCTNGICKSSSTCGPSSCSGCCSGGTCQGGNTTLACGKGGAACTACSSGQSCTSGSCAGGGGGLSATVSYPFLMKTPGGTEYFPSAFAHLLGSKPTWTEIDPNLACFALTNSSSQQLSAEIHVELSGYSTPLDQTVAVAANSSDHRCLNPTPTLKDLYALSGPVSGQIHAKVVASSVTVLDDVHPVTITTAQTAFNGKWDGTDWVRVQQWQAVFAMPKSPDVQALLAPIAARSRWGTFGGGGYDMHMSQPMNVLTWTIAGSSFLYDSAFFSKGESVAIALGTVKCTSTCTTDSIDFYVLDTAGMNQFSGAPCAGGAPVWINGTGAVTGASWTFTAPADGWYYFVFLNNCTNSAARSVSFTRTGTKADTVLDALNATYSYLRDQGITYVNVNSSFFDPSASQTIRWPKTALSDNAANCVDGSMLIASVMEAVNLEPVVVYVPKHAFMGVRNAPGDPFIWPVETTMMGTAPFTGATPSALSTGITEYYTTYATEHFDLDIKSARTAGVLPIPQ